MYESYLSWVEFVLSFQAASSKDLWLRIVLSIHVAALPKIGKYDWFIFCFTFDPNITHTRAHTRTHKDITLIFFNFFLLSCGIMCWDTLSKEYILITSAAAVGKVFSELSHGFGHIGTFVADRQYPEE